ncbi:Uncharacterised protein [Agrobacterium tumefaciens]|nr:Uncharacterised protein [Agrobacterium tumefaciens]
MIGEFRPASGETLVAAGGDRKRVPRRRQLFRRQPEGQMHAAVTPLVAIEVETLGRQQASQKAELSPAEKTIGKGIEP